jgi:hypothetical protein
MSDNRNVTAHFSPTNKVLNTTSGRRDDLVQHALNAINPATAQQEIRVQTSASGEDITLAQPVAVVLKGGYDCDFLTNATGGMSGAQSIVVSDGALVLENISVGGPGH